MLRSDVSSIVSHSTTRDAWEKHSRVGPLLTLLMSVHACVYARVQLGGSRELVNHPV